MKRPARIVDPRQGIIIHDTIGDGSTSPNTQGCGKSCLILRVRSRQKSRTKNIQRRRKNAEERRLPDSAENRRLRHRVPAIGPRLARTLSGAGFSTAFRIGDRAGSRRTFVMSRPPEREWRAAETPVPEGRGRSGARCICMVSRARMRLPRRGLFSLAKIVAIGQTTVDFACLYVAFEPKKASRAPREDVARAISSVTCASDHTLARL